MSYHRSIIPIKIYELCHCESFHPSFAFLLLFLFDWLIKSEKSLKRCWLIVMTYAYYGMQMAKCMWKWLPYLLKLVTSTMFLLCNDSHGSFMFIDLYVFLGSNLPIKCTLTLSSLCNNWSLGCLLFCHIWAHIQHLWPDFE